MKTVLAEDPGDFPGAMSVEPNNPTSKVTISGQRPDSAIGLWAVWFGGTLIACASIGGMAVNPNSKRRKVLSARTSTDEPSDTAPPPVQSGADRAKEDAPRIPSTDSQLSQHPSGRPESHGGMEPGWYPDPDQPNTVRYWDGAAWTEQRAPSTASLAVTPRGSVPRGPLLATLIFTIVGAVATAVGVFLPAADTAINFPSGGNTLIQHADGVIMLVLAVIAGTFGALAAMSQKADLKLLITVFACGAAIAILAILYGTNIPVEPINRVSEAVLEKNPLTPGAGVWATGVGGALIAIAALIGIGAGSEAERPD